MNRIEHTAWLPLGDKSMRGRAMGAGGGASMSYATTLYSREEKEMIIMNVNSELD